jgi:hypothetical protein
MSDETKRDDGGTAFPLQARDYAPQWGMTLRDYFAAQAMTALAAQWVDNDDCIFEDVAANCYDLADWMIAQRAK